MNLFFGTLPMALMAMGNKTSPDEIILIEATWKADKFSKPSFIRIKLLPQIKEREIKMSQLINFEFIFRQLQHKIDGNHLILFFFL